MGGQALSCAHKSTVRSQLSQTSAQCWSVREASSRAGRPRRATGGLLRCNAGQSDQSEAQSSVAVLSLHDTHQYRPAWPVPRVWPLTAARVQRGPVGGALRGSEWTGQAQYDAF